MSSFTGSVPALWKPTAWHIGGPTGWWPVHVHSRRRWRWSGMVISPQTKPRSVITASFLGKTGRFDGVDVIDIIMQQPATADFIAGKIYRFFVRENLSPELQTQLGSVLRASHYQITPLLERIFQSRDFYSPASVGTQLK